VLVLCVSTGSCARRPHDNFVHVNQGQVGRLVSHRSYLKNRYPEMFVGAKPLSNGNVEEQFAWNRQCQVYFEIDKASQVVVRWRFEGSEQECSLRP
jgi:hypothetical protein